MRLQKVIEDHLVRLLPFPVALPPTEALNITTEVPPNAQRLHKLWPPQESIDKLDTLEARQDGGMTM